MKPHSHPLADLLLPECQPYVVLQSDFPPTSLGMPNALGCTGRTGDVLALNWLKAQGAWRGRQPLIWVDDVKIREMCVTAAEGDAAQAAEWESQMLSAVIGHECGHIAEKSIDVSEPSTDLHRFAEVIAAYSTVVHESKTLPPFTGHDWRFVRLSLHAAYRAEKAGFEFPIHMLWSGEDYGLAEPEDFAYRLDGVFERENLIRESLFRINDFRPPHYFCELWRKYVRRWLATQTECSSGVRAATRSLDCDPNEALA